MVETLKTRPRITFSKEPGSLNKKEYIRFYLHSASHLLRTIKNCIHSNIPIDPNELKYIKQALEMNENILWSLDDIIPADEQEVNFYNNLLLETDGAN